MFEPQDTPRILALPVGADFAQCFAAGLCARAERLPPEALARTQVIANSARMATTIRKALSASGARLLPRISVVTALADQAGVSLALPEAIPPLRRQLILAQAVGKLLEVQSDVAPQGAKFALAGSLAALMDEMQAHGVSPEALEAIDVGQHSAYWRRSLDFLNIIAAHWGGTRGVDPKDRLRMVAEELARKWRDSPPDHPIIVAGSTGSQGATAILMDAVARLPNGAVVLPGWDADQPAETWTAMTEKAVSADHPQSMILGVCRRAGVVPATLPLWADAPIACKARTRLVSLALRPAPFTDEWLQDGPALRPELDDATREVALLEAASPREESLAIALALRNAAENQQTAVLITPDRTLARRVEATLARWGITPDDSAGRPLHQTPPGVFLRLVAACLGGPIPADVFVALMKHPLTGAGSAETGHKLLTRLFERQVLRGGAPWVDFDALDAWSKDTTDGDPARRAWGEWVKAALEPLTTLRAGDAGAFLEAHVTAALALVAGPDGGNPEKLWAQEDGAEAQALLAALRAEVAFAETPDARDYRALLETLLHGREVRRTLPSHPHIAIWGTLEARVTQADLVILGGVNDAIWPGAEPPDPWLNRSMRAQVGLPTPDRVIGLSAHDFQQAICAPKVIVSRALRDGDSPTVGSRWIVRLMNLLNGLGAEGKAAVEAMQERGNDWIAAARALDRPAAAVTPAPRPAPAPPVSARFRELSVTDVEKLIRDAYGVYARRTLGLYKINALGQDADALMRGNVLHNTAERFNASYPDDLPEEPVAAFMACAEAVMAEEVPWPAMRTLWRARLARVADALMRDEAIRRQNGRVVAQEIKGQRRLADPDVTLSARADRIDRRDDGTIAIFDYKSGRVPSSSERKAFQKQLVLEAAIAADGGFEDIGPAQASWLEYIGLSGQGLSEETPVEGFPFSAAETDAVWAEFGQLVAEYHSPDRGFASRMAVSGLGYDLDYDQLARLGEWWGTDDPVTVSVP